MFRPIAALLGIVALLGSSTGRAADDDAKEIIVKAIKAHGGEEFLTKHPAQRSKNKGKINLPGIGEAEFTQEVTAMIPDKAKESLELTVAGQNVTVQTLLNGDDVSLVVNGKEMPLDDKTKGVFKDAGYIMKLARFVPLVKEKGYELSLIGEDKVEGNPVVGVRISAKGQKDISMYFDKKTHLLAKVEHRSIDTTGKEISEERIIAEYGKDKNGIAIPKKVLVKHDGKPFLEAEVLEVTFVEKIDDSEFKK